MEVSQVVYVIFYVNNSVAAIVLLCQGSCFLILIGIVIC